MPYRSPFTRLCQMAAAGRDTGRVDLHIHSTASDGLFTPQEVIAHARKAGLAAVAITDHDTLAGYEQVKGATGMEVIAGVEITTEHAGREFHLLGYFIDPVHPDLSAALARLGDQRRERFDAIADHLRQVGAPLEERALQSTRAGSSTLGPRHLARLLVESKQASNLNDAFISYLAKPAVMQLPKARLPIAEAIELVEVAGGVSSWAHPPSDTSQELIIELKSLGLNAVECEYPWAKPSHGRSLRAMAEEAGLAVTGGSDCHGPFPRQRAIGTKGIDRKMLEVLRSLSDVTGAVETV